MGATSRYTAPKATIDPDRSKSWIKRATPVVMAHKLQWFSALIFSFLGLIIQVWIPKILQNGITNSLINKTQPLHNYVELIAVLALFTGVFGYISRTNLFKVAYAIEFDLRNILYEHFTRMSFPFYDRVQSGQLISRANSDIRSVQMYLTFAPMILVQCSIALVAFAFMLSISVPLAFVAMASMPFIYIVGIKMRKSLFPVSWLIQSRLAEVATVVDENVNGVRVVRSFAAEQQQLGQLAKAADRVQWGYIKDADLRARFAPLVQNLSQVGLVLVLLVGGWLVIHEHLPVASIVSFNLYLVMMQAPFMMLGMLIMMGQRASASADRIYEIIDEKPTIVDRPDAIDLVDCQGDVEFDDVSFAYADDSLLTKPGGDDGPREILRNLNLHLHPGETIALVGRTGSGKSTVARVLARFYDATGGTVRVDGHDVRDLTLTSLRANIGVVLDEPFLFSVSIRDNIAYGRPDASMEEVMAAAEAAGATGFINRLADGYDTVVGERGYTLSGGQRQRIAIARALLVNPPILILDDATSAIDVKVEQRIHSSLRVLMEGRTTLIIAHRLSTISLADRVVLLDNGRIVADGTHAELLASTPLYSEVLAQATSEEQAAAEAAAGYRGPRAGRRRPRARGRGTRAAGRAPRDRRRGPRAREGCDLMFGGGGVGPPMGGGGAPGSAQAGLPFGGIPHELQAGVDLLLDEEPERGEPDVVFTQLPTAHESKKLTLTSLLMEYPGHVRAGRVLGGDDRPVHPARPEPRLLRHQPWPDAAPLRLRRRGAHGGAVPGVDRRVGQRAVRAGAGDGPPRLVGHERPAHQGVPPPAAALARLLHRGEGGRRHEPHDERHREPAAAAAGRAGPVRHSGPDHGRHHGLPLRHQRASWPPSPSSPCCLPSSSCRSGSSGPPSAATTRCATASRSCWPTSPRACRACAS